MTQKKKLIEVALPLEAISVASAREILVVEWVAYACQLHDQSDLPAGGFETQFTFDQVLTESAKLAKNCLLVISLPASDTSRHSHSDDVKSAAHADARHWTDCATWSAGWNHRGAPPAPRKVSRSSVVACFSR